MVAFTITREICQKVLGSSPSLLSALGFFYIRVTATQGDGTLLTILSKGTFSCLVKLRWSATTWHLFRNALQGTALLLLGLCQASRALHSI